MQRTALSLLLLPLAACGATPNAGPDAPRYLGPAGVACEPDASSWVDAEELPDFSGCLRFAHAELGRDIGGTAGPIHFFVSNWETAPEQDEVYTGFTLETDGSLGYYVRAGAHLLRGATTGALKADEIRSEDGAPITFLALCVRETDGSSSRLPPSAAPPEAGGVLAASEQEGVPTPNGTFSAGEEGSMPTPPSATTVSSLWPGCDAAGCCAANAR